MDLKLIRYSKNLGAFLDDNGARVASIRRLTHTNSLWHDDRWIVEVEGEAEPLYAVDLVKARKLVEVRLAESILRTS